MAFDLKQASAPIAAAYGARSVSNEAEIRDGDVCVIISQSSGPRQRVCYALSSDSLAQTFYDHVARADGGLPDKAGRCELGFKKASASEARALVAEWSAT